jgi:hypothetical protein
VLRDDAGEPIRQRYSIESTRVLVVATESP